MEKRKKIIFWGITLFSLLLLFDFAKVASGGWSLSNIEEFGLPEAEIDDIVFGLAEWIFMIFGVVSVGAFMVSGIMYLVSAGDDGMITRSKKYMTYSIVGVIVGLSGYVIIQAVSLMLSGSQSF